jgi:hypothetical protein
MPYSAVPKDPNAVLDYTLDWSTELPEGDTVDESEWLNPGGIAITTSQPDVNLERVTASGGTLRQTYRLTNRVTSTQGRVQDWVLDIRIEETVVIPTGPPYAGVSDAVEYQPKAEGASALKVGLVLEDAADLVAHIVPPPDEVKTTLAQAMDASQVTATLADTYDFPSEGALQIENELLYYSAKDKDNRDVLTKLQRGRRASVPASHAQGVDVVEIGYPLRAQRAELAVFEWLWDTRGYIPGKSGVIGSESYSIGDEVFALIKRIMGPYYGGEGGIRGVVPMGSFRRYRPPSDIQRGSYNIG